MKKYKNPWCIGKLKRWYTILTILLPATTVYASPIHSISYGEIIALLMIILVFIDMAMKKEIVFTFSSFWVYLFYSLIASVGSCIVLSIESSEFSCLDSVQRVLRDSLYFSMALFFAPKYFDFEFGKKFMSKVILFLGIFAIAQFSISAIFHVYLPGIIPVMKTTISGGVSGADIIDIYTKNMYLDGYVRPNAFFSEPAVIAQFVSIGLLLELFPQDGIVNFKRSIFYSIVMVITFSVNAYVALMLCWILWALHDSRTKHSNNKLVRFILFMFVLGVFVFVMTKNAKMAGIVNRIVELINGTRIEGSSVIRVIRGMAFYFKMPLFYQIFGSGFGNFLQFKEIYNVSTIYEQVDEYMNTNAYILVSAGMVGFVLYLYALFRQSKGKMYFSRALTFLLIVFGISSSIYSSAVYVIMLAFFITTPQKGIENGYQNNNITQYL